MWLSMSMMITAYFYPRPPRGGRPERLAISSCTIYFYPRPPRGGRPAGAMQMTAVNEFLSTPSARRATFGQICLLLPCHDFYPRPPRGGRRTIQHSVHPLSQISIHALREEGDRTRPTRASSGWNFYPRPPRGGRRQHTCFGLQNHDISIHALREEGDKSPPIKK